MKKIIKKLEKRQMFFAVGVLAFIAFSLFVFGGFLAVGGIGLAMAVPALPELTDKEQAFLQVVKEQVISAQTKFEKDYISAAKMDELIKGAINEHIKDGVTIEQFEKLNKELESVGLVVAKLKDQKTQPEHKTVRSVIKHAFSADGITEKIRNVFEAKAGEVKILDSKAVADITTGNVTTDTGGNAILDMINADEINSMRLRDQFIENYCTVTRTGKPVYTYVDYLPKEGDVDFVLEANEKPQLDLQVAVRTITPAKAAGYQVLSEEAIDDVPRMESESEMHLLKKYILKRQNGILFGTGVAPEPEGVTVSAPAFDSGTWTGDTKAAPNLYDAIIAVMNQIELAANYTDDIDYYPNVCFLNPADYNNLLILQSDENYVFNDVNGARVVSVNGMTVVKRKEIPQGYILMGDFTKLNVINYIDYSIRMGWINDQFINNLFTMVGEGRFYVLVRELDKLAFVYDTIANVIAALTTPEV